MPAFYPQSMPTSLPLTPPHSGSGYHHTDMHYSCDPYAPHSGHPRQDSAFDYSQGFMQQPMACGPAGYQYSQHPAYQTATSLPPISSYYEPMGAPILPPLRIHDRAAYNDDLQRRVQEQQNAVAREQQRQSAKEEKATGGVSAKLDYDMERMTDFVSEAAQSIFNQTVQSPPSFRKWVHQVLAATRLPSATILLSLHYLNDRIAKYPNSVQTGDNQIYRLLAVSLVLGSKFLDDNTFINRSWSDVTAIKVSELNMLEMKWLHLINYELHIDPTVPTGMPAWLDAWTEFDAKQTAKQHQARLSPLNTNLHRHTNQRYSPYPSPNSAAPSRQAYEAPHSARSQYSNASYSSNPWSSGDRSFDDFYRRQNRYPTLSEIHDSNRRASEEQACQSESYAFTQPAQYYAPSAYASAWDQSAWSGVHRYDCACTSCAYQHYRNYPMAPNYASHQTVIG